MTSSKITTLPPGGAPVFDSGDRLLVITDVPRPRWWQFRKLFTYYILRRRTREVVREVAGAVGCTVTLRAPLPPSEGAYIIRVQNED
jgi:hypothetical protein